MSEAMSRYERRRLRRSLREEQKRKGKGNHPTVTLPNRKSSLETIEEEKAAVQGTTEEKLRVYRLLLPGLLKKLAHIPDPRNLKKVKHKTNVLMLYGILMFAFQMSSRRRTNREMTTPQLIENLQAVFPELEEMPHQDTLCRLLKEIDVERIESIYIDLLRQLIGKKKFKHLLHKKRYLVAIDGTQKYESRIDYRPGGGIVNPASASRARSAGQSEERGKFARRPGGPSGKPGRPLT